MSEAERLKELFSQALELPVTAERERFLEEACRDDPGLRRQINSLLDAHERAGGFLGKTVQLPAPAVGLEEPGTMIGRYKLLQKIGEGGFGVVYMAEQVEPMQRKVALKIIKAGMDTREVVARFEAERQALALMDHPNIASVFDGGATATGRPYFVMELVQGIPITKFCDERRLSTRERLELFMQICHAVQHAHQKGVIHRDLKPSNILVTVQDDQPVPKVIDFGVAKATQARLTEKTLFTRFHQWIGTPAYMSPEQAGLGSLDVDTRSDIYSLGVLLYELLTGRTPFDTQKLLEAGYDAVLRAIRDKEPPKPSTRLSTLAKQELSEVAARRSAEPTKLNRLVHGDLDWIVMKALEKDRKRRYETANGLAEDIERHLDQKPIVARPPNTPYLALKFVRRNRALVIAGTAIVVALGLGVVVSAWQARRANRQRDRAEANQQRAIQAQAEEARQRQAAEAARRQAETAELTARERAYAADVRNAQVALEKGNRGQALALLRSHRPQRGQADLRGLEWRYLWQAALGQDLRVFEHGALVHGMAMSGDGQWLVTSGTDGRIHVWNVTNGTSVADFAGPNPLDRAYFDAANRTIAASPTEALFTMPTTNGVEVRKFGSLGLVAQLPGATFPIEFSRDGRLLAALHRGEDRLTLRVWEAGSWQSRLVSTNVSRNNLSVRFCPNTRFLLWAHAESTNVYRFDLEQSRELQPFAGLRDMIALAISPDSRWVVVANWNGYARVLDFATGAPGPLWQPHPGWPLGLAFSPDSQILASGGNDQLVRLWHAGTWEAKGALAGHENEVWDIVYAPDGGSLFAASKDGTVRQFPSEARPPRYFTYEFTVQSHGHCLGWAVSEHGERALVVRSDSTQEMWDGPSRAVIETRRFPLTSSEVFSNLRAPGLCAYYATNGDLYLLDADASEPVTRHALGLRQPQLLAVTPDGLYLLALEDARAQTPGRLGVWNVPLNRLERELDRGKLYVGGSLSADGRLALAFTGDSSDVLVWTVGRREPLSVLHNSSWFLSRSSFSPDGKQAAVASFDGTVRVWDAASARQALPVLKGHRSGVTSVQFANDGRTLLTCDSVVLHFWNLKTGQEMLLLEGLNAPILSRHNGSLGWWDISDTCPAGQMRWRATPLPTLAEIDAIER